MKYEIQVARVRDDDSEPWPLGQSWEVDADDPGWRDTMPAAEEIAALIEEDKLDGQFVTKPSLELAARVLRRLGYDDIAGVVEDVQCSVEQDLSDAEERDREAKEMAVQLADILVYTERMIGATLSAQNLERGDGTAVLALDPDWRERIAKWRAEVSS